MTAFESLRYTLVVVAGPNNEFVWTRVYDSGGGVYCAHAMAAVARHDSMSLFGIDNLLSGYGTGVGPKTLCITSPTARRQLETPRHWEPTHRRPTCSRPAFTDASAARIGALSDSRATRRKPLLSAQNGIRNEKRVCISASAFQMRSEEHTSELQSPMYL